MREAMYFGWMWVETCLDLFNIEVCMRTNACSYWLMIIETGLKNLLNTLWKTAFVLYATCRSHGNEDNKLPINMLMIC